jgi:hypothetical protein
MMVAAGCSGMRLPGNDNPPSESSPQTLSLAEYQDRVHGAWQAIMVANRSGIDLQGLWLDEPGPGSEIELLLPEQWSTDDDTHVEWLDLHIMETHGINPTYEQIRDEWVDHLNGDIWVATLRARELMDEGIVPPDTGSGENNPDGVWSMDAQLETELFGLLAPGRPDAARERAAYFAKVTNSGLAVDVSAFYAHLYADAFFVSDVDELLNLAVHPVPFDSKVFEMVAAVRGWHLENPDDWRATRAKIAEAYDDDPEWWASKVNFAVTIMALLHGEGDLIETINIAGLAGWDADNNMTTAAGLLGIIIGFDGLPEPIASSTDVYFNEDLSGDLPQFDSVANIAKRTVALGVEMNAAAGGRTVDDVMELPEDS